MDFLKRLFSGASNAPQSRVYTFDVKCRRCGEVIPGRVDLQNDLSAEYEDGSEYFHVRKVLMGGSLCFNRVEVHLKFSRDKTFLESEVIGGEIVS